MGRCIEHGGVEWKLVLGNMWGKKKSKVSKRILHYYWSNENLMLNGLMVIRFKERQ